MSDNKEQTLQRKRARELKARARVFADFADLDGDVFETDLTELAVKFENGSDE